jgi:hypothetical protein
VRDHDRHWHYFGAGLLAVGLAFLGIPALAATAQQKPIEWAAWEAVFAYVCFRTEEVQRELAFLVEALSHLDLVS